MTDMLPREVFTAFNNFACKAIGLGGCQEYDENMSAEYHKSCRSLENIIACALDEAYQRGFVAGRNNDPLR